MMPRKSSCIGVIIEGTKWLPVLITIIVYTWGWYAFTFKLAIESVTSLIEKFVYLVIFHILYVLSFWSYLQTIFAPIGRVPNKFFLPPEMSEDLSRANNDQQKNDILLDLAKKNDLPVACRTYLGGIRYCEKCNMIKPDRCHHCSVCGVCVLRMDHHCPWINNCVSFTNYKFFVLFLGYTCALCAFTCLVTFPYFIKFWSLPNQGASFNNQSNNSNIFQDPNSTQSSPFDLNYNQVPFSVKFNVLFLFCLSGMLGLGVMFLLVYHIHLLLHNRSTLEAFRPPLMAYGPDSNAFNLGKKENARQLFGRSTFLWFLPIFTTEGSGLTYDQRPQLAPGDEEARQELLNYQNNNHSNNANLRNGNDTGV